MLQMFQLLSAENTKHWLSIPTEACIERYFEEENNEKSCYPSANMTITGYSDSRYCTELRCSIDSLPTYCSVVQLLFRGFLLENMYSLS
jgi:hypothetical protein